MNAEFFQDFKWDNQSEVTIKNDSLLIRAHPDSDYFNDPAEGAALKNNAAYFYRESSGDFVLKAKVTHSFVGIYDACVLMIKKDDHCWVKLCFEMTDIGTHAVVSVVTNGVSDDANGVDINGNTVYIQMIKKDDLFALHYSLDGKEYKMVRYFTLPVGDTFKLGFVAQSPLGEGGEFLFEDIVFRNESVEDMRKGV